MRSKCVFFLMFSALAVTGIGAQAQSLTSHFQSWLNQSAYSGWDFVRSDLSGGSYGGKLSGSDPVVNQPVIFIHGNSDKAVGSAQYQTGWTASINYFLNQGYTSAELYATTWGPADGDQASDQYHSKFYISKVRAFILAVLDYTGADKVDIISHSMGVTLARKAIKGGSGNDLLDGGSYNLGPALTADIDTFVGISGANQGLVTCYLTGPTTPTCGSTNGFYPGYLWWGLGPYGVSNILVDLNSWSGYEGNKVYSIWSYDDGIIGYNNLVYGTRTSRIPGQDGEAVFSNYDHFESKDLTPYYQWRMVAFHATN